MFEQAMLLVMATLPFAACVKIYLLERRSETWPRIRGRIVEKPPQTFFERSGDIWYLNLDSDFFLEYEVGGRIYLHPASEDATVHFAGIKLWRKPPKPDPWIRYDPDHPEKCIYEQDRGTWKLVLGFAMVFAFVVLQVSPY